MNETASSTTKPEPPPDPVVIIGAGLAGLSCARRLAQSGVPILVLEAENTVGGRVRTDCVNGFLLDRGFQVFLTAYPEAAALLHYPDLHLNPFYPGALVQFGPRRYRFADPWKRPFAGISTLLAPITRLPDAMRIARLRSSVLRHTSPRAQDAATTTCEFLRERGLSERVIERFFRPFFGGVFLERDLRTPSNFFTFVFAMFSRGMATLPARGMHAIPRQLAAALPTGTVRLRTTVDSVEPGRVRLASGETIASATTVVATNAEAARKLVPDLPTPSWNSTTTLYYAAPKSPVQEGILVLNGMGRGLVNHVSVPSDVSDRYAPPGSALVSVNVIGIPKLDDDELSRGVLDEMRAWFDGSVADWRLIRIYRIQHALPALETIPATTPRIPGAANIVLCGDYLEDPSINGAMAGGRKAAETILESLYPARARAH